ncbi:hypothetical protein BC826DRAFT_880451, partial [Russula brevipes]
LQDSDIPRRSKVREAIINEWGKYFHIMRKELENVPGRISFTADIWSSQSRYPYLAVTAHWI